MALSYIQYPGNGSNRSFPVPYPYINKAHTGVKVGGVPVTFTWTSHNFIQLDVTPADGVVVEVRRTTPNIDRMVDFVDGSTLTESDLDLTTTQFLYLAQEAQDRADEAPTLTAQNTYDFKGRRATNLGEPVAAQDAATKGFVETGVSSAVVIAKEAAASAQGSATASAAALAQARIAQMAAEYAAANPDLSSALLRKANLKDLFNVEEARTNLGLKGAAVLEVGKPGGVAFYDDPRFSAGGGSSNPVFDRQATGGHSRTFTQIAADSVSIMEWLSDAQIAGTADAGPALNACANYCRSSGRLTMHVPSFPGAILINTPVNFEGIHIAGPGRGGVPEAHFRTTADIDAFYAFGPFASISGIRHDHEGNGRHVNLPKSLNYNVCDCYFYALKASATAPMMTLGGSNYFVRGNRFTNLRTGGYSIAAVRATDDICINNSILGNYFGGPGKGILIASTGNYVVGDAGHPAGSPIHRQEGLEISSNQSILYGGPFIEIGSVLNLRILNNMIDQPSTIGAIVFAPQGSIDSLGTYGVQIIGNYISTPQDPANGIAINHLAGSGNSVAGVMIVGNQICFCGEGVYFGSNIRQITFSANVFHSLAKQTCVRVADANSLPHINFSKTNCIDGYGLKLNTVNVNGQWRSTTSAAAATNDGNWTNNNTGGRQRYIEIPHLLAVAPQLSTIQLQCSVNTDIADAVTAYPVVVSNSSVIVKVATLQQQADGVVTVSMKCAVNGPNS